MRISIYLERPEFATPILDAGKLLRGLGVEVVEGVDPEADFQIIGNQHFRSLEASRDSRLKFPIGIWERADQEVVAPQNRDLIVRDDVVLWFKDFLIRDPALHNAPLINGYYHYNLLQGDATDEPSICPEVLLGPDELGKLRCINSFPSYDLLATWRDMTPLSLHDRDIDVSFAASMIYDDAVVRKHRLGALQAMLQIPDRVTIAATGRALSDGAYLDTIARSKIVVSPWSMVTASLKDWEIMFAGCVLIKPDCSLLESYHPDIFADKRNYVSCRTDFSDLKVLVEEILENYPDYYARAQLTRQQLLTCRDRAPIARDLYTIVTRALGRDPDPRLENILAEASPELRWIPEGLGYSSSRQSQDQAVTNYYRSSINLLSAANFRENWAQFFCTLTLDPAINDVPGNHPAARMAEDRTPNTSHEILHRFSLADGATNYAFSFLTRADDRTALWIWLGVGEFDDRVQALFDLKVGSVAAFSQVGDRVMPLRVGMIPMTNGWWWCWLSAAFDETTNSGGAAINLANDIRMRRYEGDGRSGLWLALPRIERGARALLEIQAQP